MEIILNASFFWQFTKEGTIQITGVNPIFWDEAEQTNTSLELSESQEKALLYVLAKCGILQEVEEDLENQNDYFEHLINAYEDRLESEYMERNF
jgi:hypothetical protein